MKDFKNFKGKHPLRFAENLGDIKTTLADTQVGDMFIREGAICMRVQDRTEHETGRRFRMAPPEYRIPIINLQSASVWYAEPIDVVYMVDAQLSLKNIYKHEGA